MITRRNFVGACALSVTAPALAIEPIKRSGKQNLKLSLAAYSLRNLLPFPRRGKKDAKMDMLDFVDYCAKLGLDGTELTGYFFPDPLTSDYINRIKRRTHVLGLDISGGAIGNNFAYGPGAELDKQLDYTKKWIDHYAAMGAPVIRVFAGHPKGKGADAAAAVKNIITNLHTACEYAGKRGVILAMENHDFTTDIDRYLEVIKAIDSPWFGANLDSGNIKTDGDPYKQLERIAPYAVNAQIKVMIPRGGKREAANLKRIVNILRDGGYSGYVVLEYEEKEDPFKAIPRYLDELRKAIG